MWNKEKMIQANAYFGTSLPVSDEKLAKEAFSMVFDCYSSIEEMLENGWETKDIIGNDMLYIMDGKILFFNEVNYDKKTGLPIGDFTDKELSELRKMKEDTANENMDIMIKTVRCHYKFLQEYCNKIGKEHIISITSCFGEQYGEHFFTIIYDTPGIVLTDC